MRPTHLPKRRTAVALALLTAAISAVAISAPAAAAPDEEAQSKAPVSAGAQIAYETQLDTFLASNPQPIAPSAGATAAQQNAYWKSMSSWWDAVPWEAVAGQWGCDAGVEGVNFNPADKNGVVSASHGGVMDCGVVLDDLTLAAVSTPVARSDQEAQLGILASYCSPSGASYRHCLSTSGTTLTATFQYLSSGNITGASRAGFVGVGNPCAQGSVVALGPVGIGAYGSVWYASGTINQNSQYSASFIVGGSGVYSRYCAIL